MTVFIAGCLLPLAFAPINFAFLAFFSPAVLLFTWLRATPKRAFLLGYLFGVGLFLVGTYWIFISINVFGNTPLIISVFITALFMLFLSLYPATLGYVFVKLFAKTKLPLKCLGVFPALWVTWEWLRGTLFSGFPWLFLGYSQLNTPLHGLAPLFGVYGVSFAVSLISGSLILLLTTKNHRVKLITIVLFFSLIIFSWSFTNKQWTTPNGKPFKVSLVQGNIPKEVKWEPGYLNAIVKRYTQLTDENWNSKLIIWPEGSIPAFADQVMPYLNLMNETAKFHQDYLLLGILIRNKSQNKYYNGMLMLGAGHGTYLKRHLVPFGEYLPLKFLFNWFIQYFQVPMSNFSAGPKHQTPIKLFDKPVATFICYEIAFPDLVLDSMKNAELIISVSDDSWFGRSIALGQQVQMAQMRSLETGRYSLYCANTGITAFINPQGQYIGKAPENKKFVLTHQVPLMQGKTPLMIWGYYPVIILILFLLLLGLIFKSKK